MKFSTSTITRENKITPWLAADGLLSYSPFSPPHKDYFFLYNFILPKIFHPTVNLRQHYWFGDHEGKESWPVQLLLNFWNNARTGKITLIFFQDAPDNFMHFEAPIAIFQCSDRWKCLYYLFMQHGSYLKIPVNQQQLLEETGFVLLYRGIGSAKEFCINRMPDDQHVIDRYRQIQLHYFSDSMRSFNVAHARTFRSETGYLSLEYPAHKGLFPDITHNDYVHDQIDKLIKAINQCYTLDKNIAKRKFGPSYVTFKTPVTNIRITTYFAGEFEVKVLSLDKLIPIKATRCRFKGE